MNRIHISYTAVALFLSSCAGVPGGESGVVGGRSRVDVHPGNTRVVSFPSAMEEKEYDGELIAKTIKKADFEFYNACIYSDPDSWKGRTVCVLGVYPGTGARSRQYARNNREFFMEGDYNGHPIALIVMLDHALPREVSYDKPVRTISPLQEIYVFGRLQGTDNIVSEEGYTRLLPVLKCLMIYDKDDDTFRRPLWASSVFERMPEGTVTTDSLNYEFDVPKKR